MQGNHAQNIGLSATTGICSYLSDSVLVNFENAFTVWAELVVNGLLLVGCTTRMVFFILICML